MWVQLKLKETSHSHAEELRQLNQDLVTAGDLLRAHKQTISATLDEAASHVACVHREMLAM